MTAIKLAHICQHLSSQVSLKHISTLFNPSYFAWQKPQIQIAICEIDKDLLLYALCYQATLQPSRKEREKNKTVRVSAIPRAIFITTTWVERETERERGRERERSQSTVKEVYHYKRLVKLTLVKLDFSHFKYKSMQSQKKRKKTNSEKENKDNPRIKKQKPERRHIHRLESVVLGKWENFFD